MTAARLYGHSLGESSFVQVTRGFREALEEAQIFAGFMPIDNVSRCEEEPPPGALAPVSFNTGSPGGVTVAKAYGAHEKKWLLVAPNSDKIPAEMLEWFPRELDGILSPSEWGAEVVRRELRRVHWADPLPVVVCPHGVGPEMRPSWPDHDKLVEAYEKGEFRVLHMTSTLAERKSTKTLIAAWRRFVATTNVALHSPTLTVVCDPLAIREVEKLVEGLGARHVTVTSAWRWPRAELAAFYRGFHLVVCPSRAEGFGLVPLEARACGVAVAATRCTGHREHITEEDVSPHGAVVEIRHRPEDAIDDYAGARAPVVDVGQIEEGLAESFSFWPVHSTNAMALAPGLASEWSWAKKTGAVLQKIVEEA